MKNVMVVLLVAVWAFRSVAQPNTPLITAETVADLELGFILPSSGYCNTFSQDDRLVANYDMVTGEPIFQINHFVHEVPADENVTILQPETAAALTPETRVNSDRLNIYPDHNLLLVQRLGAFELLTGLRSIEFYGFVSLSDDGSLLAVPEQGIYDVEDWSLIIPLEGDMNTSPPAISPDNRLFAIGQDGVYDLPTGERQFAISGVLPVFSPDSRWLAVERDGVYEVASGERVLALENAPFVVPQFSADSRWLADANAVYDMTTQEKQFDMDIWNQATFSPNSELVVGADGVYELESGERLFELIGASVNFNVDGSLVASADDRVYDVTTGEVVLSTLGSPTFSPGGTLLSVSLPPYCLIYGLPDYPYPYRSGLVEPYSGANVRRAPSANSSILFSTRDLLAVSARTVDDQWFRIFHEQGEGWVAAEAVAILEIPDDVPVENP